MIDVHIYQTADGKRPFVDWIEALKDRQAQLRIRKRIRQMTLGHVGDSKSVGAGVHELRFFFGKGYRVYYGKDGDTVVVLLTGGDKSRQSRDIETAKAYWKDYKERM